ncbi:MAG: imidazole glycerol phosphate synthase subunit HisH [Eubacteriales bacterium]|nr:imidazole glycerol phosphate synthase subunit HisH [Eubacteriales bacterium]
MTGIIDYDAGNVKSVEKALAFLGEEAVLTRDPSVLLAADRVILPGVGSFGDAMEKLKRYGLVEVIRELNERNTPFLGICLGLQLLFESSQESPGVEGLSLLKGKIVRIPEGTGPDGFALKIPHIGWNSLDFPKKGRLFEGLPRESYVYFVHSYYLRADEDIVTATAQYGVTIDASVEKGNLFACQFHPEKSSETGLHILRNFVRIGREDC